MADRSEQIVKWLERFKRSGLFARHRLPFNRAQFYGYCKRPEEGGTEAVADGRTQGWLRVGASSSNSDGTSPRALAPFWHRDLTTGNQSPRVRELHSTLARSHLKE